MAPDAGTRGVIETLPGSLPMSVVPDDVNPELVAVSCISCLHSLTDADFIRDALWKDLYALTGLPRTFSTAKAIETAWNDVFSTHKPFDFTFTPGTAEVVRKTPKLSWVEGRFTFRTKSCPASFCSGMVSLVPDGGNTWKIWILRTILERLEGHPDVDVPNPQTPIINWEANEFDCLVVGAGQCGLSTAGRLQSLGVNYLLIDKNDNIGDNWLLRYDSMKLHTVRAYAHLPFERTFSGDSYPELLSKYDLAKCYKLWADKLGIAWSSILLTINLHLNGRANQQWLWGLRTQQGQSAWLIHGSCNFKYHMY
ncbi:flavin-containing monooxygenase [Histoplasma capsulatum]|uniref:Flavin-containing monooxygenase n=1 Tax=Ajellomyces capsulatus TaxID=5037 RepID=A0A8A1MDR9_AJECA|nr:flavin-containing monooxygenase [Histoplasma capsulatum]